MLVKMIVMNYITKYLKIKKDCFCVIILLMRQIRCHFFTFYVLVIKRLMQHTNFVFGCI
jgi:hypothetical protein